MESGSVCSTSGALRHYLKQILKAIKPFPSVNVADLTSLGTGGDAKSRVDSLDGSSPFSALDYNLISFGI